MKDIVRVAALIDTIDISGPGRQLVALAPRLQRHGVDLRLVLFHRHGDPRAPFEDFVEAAGITYAVARDAWRFDPRIVLRVGRILSEWNPTIVQTHNYRPGAIAFALRRLGARWRWAGFFHGLTAEDRKVRIYHWLDQRSLRHADRVVVMAQAQRSLFEACSERVIQISNAVLPLPAPDKATTESVTALLSGLERTRFAVIARLSHEKGVDLFLEAIRLLRDRGVSLSAIIAGDGPERARLTALTGSLDLSTFVRFLGTVNPIEPLYHAVDVVVLPSRSEGLPNVLLEALRAQRKIVATSVGAVPEVVRDQRAVHLVEPGSAEALAEAMMKASAAALSQDAIDAQQAILERYSIDRRLVAHLELYRTLTEAHELP